MKRKQIILVALAAVLVVVALGIAEWRMLSRPTGLSAPIELVDIPPGEFMMGSPEDEEGRYDNETLHPVKITYAFKMGKTEVTQQQWLEVMGTTIQQQRDKALREAGHLPSFGKRFKEVRPSRTIRLARSRRFGTKACGRQSRPWWLARKIIGRLLARVTTTPCTL